MAATHDQLARERAGAPLAAVGAMLAAILPLAGATVAAQAGEEPVDKTSKLLFVHDHATTLFVGAALAGLGLALVAFPLVYLYRAAKARKPELPRVALICAVGGAVGLGLVTIAFEVTLVVKAADFAQHGDRTYPEAKAAFESGELKAIGAVALASGLALAFAYVMICLNAMRVGLLTRFMGILGIIAGALIVFRLPGPPVVQSFWLGALVALFLGRWPSGVPPAWKTGEAVPWPTQQELREQRETAPGVGATTEPEPAAAGGGAAAPARGASPSKKRRRKKRRR